MIPKTIHYIWLGGRDFTATQLMIINSWKRNLPDYKFVEWNEKNIPYDYLCSKNLFFKECWERRLWAFVADYLRLWILNQYGGIYLDTDVEIVKNLDPLLNNKAFMGYEAGSKELGEYIGTGVIGAEKKNESINRLLSFYDKEIWNTEDYINTIIFKKLYMVNKEYFFSDIELYPRQYFSPYSPYDYVTGKSIETATTFAIHWYSSKWGMSLKGYTFITTKSIKNSLIREIVKLKRVVGFMKTRN